jgi:hypothetical protein
MISRIILILVPSFIYYCILLIGISYVTFLSAPSASDIVTTNSRDSAYVPLGNNYGDGKRVENVGSV